MAQGNKKPERKSYSSEERANALAALAANGGNLKGMAKKLNISIYYLRKWQAEDKRAKSTDEPSTSIEEVTPHDRNMSSELETIAWQLLEAIPERIDKAPLHQLISTLKIIRETLQSIKDDGLNLDTHSLLLSKMTDEQLEQLEQVTTILLRNCASSAIPELAGAFAPNDTESLPTLAATLESALPSAPFLTEAAIAAKYHSTELPGVHKWLIAQLRTLHERRGSRLAVIAPRESAKTTWVTLAYVLRCAIEGLESYILLISDSEDQAEQFLAAIRNELESGRIEVNPHTEEMVCNPAMHGACVSIAEELQREITLAEAYPDACGQGPEWRKDHIRLRNGVLIESLGRGSKIRGRKNRQHRPTLIVIDDCQSNRDIFSSSERIKTLNWFKHEVIPCGSESTNFISVGSALHREAVAVQSQKMVGWASATFPAIESFPERLDLWKQWELLATNLADDDRAKTAADFYARHQEDMDRGGISFWPSYKPLLSLMMKRAEIGERQFDTEYQGNPGTPEGAEWPSEYFDRADLMFAVWPLDIAYTIVALDPSKGRADGDGDYQALAVISLTREGKLWVDCECNREPIPMMVKRAVQLAKLYRPQKMVVETNQGLDLLIPEFERYMKEEKVIFPVENVEHYQDSKIARIRRLGVYLSRGQIRIRETKGGRMLLDQLRDFPKGTHDDAPDAVELGIRRLEMLTMGK